jgi:hypothetical protein
VVGTNGTNGILEESKNSSKSQVLNKVSQILSSKIDASQASGSKTISMWMNRSDK